MCITGKDVEGSGRALILIYYLVVFLEELRKTKKTSVRIAGLRPEI
jgi:hypothetical protein